MENSSIQKIIAYLKRYLTLQRDFVTLTLAEKITRLLTIIVAGVIVLLLLALLLIFASISLGALLSDLLDSYSAGFGIVAAIYLIVTTLIYVNRRRWIYGPVANYFASLLVDPKEES